MHSDILLFLKDIQIQRLEITIIIHTWHAGYYSAIVTYLESCAITNSVHDFARISQLSHCDNIIYCINAHSSTMVNHELA